MIPGSVDMILASVVVIPVSVAILISSKDANVDVTELQYTDT